jgi:hypothetical protein
MEIPLDKILWRWADFAKLKTVLTPSHDKGPILLFLRWQLTWSPSDLGLTPEAADARLICTAYSA